MRKTATYIAPMTGVIKAFLSMLGILYHQVLQLTQLYTVLPALRCHLRFLAIKPFLLGVKTSGFKRKICFIESTIVPSYNSIMGAIFEYDINQA